MYPGPLLRPVELRPAPRPRPRRVSAQPAPAGLALHRAAGGGGALRVWGEGGAAGWLYTGVMSEQCVRSAAGSSTLRSSWSVGGCGRATTWTPPVTLVSGLTYHHHLTISLSPSCPGLPCPTTTPSTLATCPPQHPEPWSPCDLEEYGHHCPYGGQVHR